jgi:hypothetical protein
MISNWALFVWQLIWLLFKKLGNIFQIIWLPCILVASLVDCNVLKILFKLGRAERYNTRHNDIQLNDTQHGGFICDTHK